jgi:hydroxymethylglutaryl-CoA lyase|uniref:Hydroxymethylglutaryl-CoA lyase n=1 Tax=Desulfomonile tiedjei TaxID=2358 RepID=A0A7C4AT78_9BACT
MTVEAVWLPMRNAKDHPGIQESEDTLVYLQEVGPRDGLQNEQTALTPEARAALIDRLVSCGLSRIQIGSFVNPRRVPQMLGTHLVWRLIRKKKGVRFSVLVLNEKGLELAIKERVPHVEIYVSASETHSMKNTGFTVDEALTKALNIITRAREEGLTVTAGVMCAFGCFYEGKVPDEAALRLVQAFERCGPTEICLADTTGMGVPEQVTRLVNAVVPIVGVDRIGLHLHDTHGHGYDNLKAALASGVRRFDTSIGGLGGCPFIPGAAGNIATGRTASLLESMGLYTGINVACLEEEWGALQTRLGKKPPEGRVISPS